MLNIASTGGQSHTNTTIKDAIDKKTIAKLSNLIASGKEPAIEYESGGETHAMAQIVHGFAETCSLKAVEQTGAIPAI